MATSAALAGATTRRVRAAMEAGDHPYIRPLPGLTAVMAGLGPRVARERGRMVSVAIRAMTAPLAFFTRVGDRIAVRVAKP